MANAPKVLNVNYETTTEKVSGGQGTSSATVLSAPKELSRTPESQVGENLTNVKGVATGNTEERSLKVSKDVKGGSYVSDTNQASDPGRVKRNVVNTVTVEDVKALIKKYGGGNSYSKEQIDEMLATIREGQYVEVDTTEYPTLESFLASEGEQGTVYLYPVGNEENNYYQYIWEVNEWIPLGTTALDLSGYPTLSGNNTFTGDNEFEKAIKSPNVPNAINANDIVNNTLTDEQYNLIMNGKPTLIKGTFLGIRNPVLTSPYDGGGNYVFGFKLGQTSSGYQSLSSVLSQYRIAKSSKIIQTFEGDKRIRLDQIATINDVQTNQFYKKPQASVTVTDGGTITDSTLKDLIQNEQPIKLNGYTGYFSCDDGTNYQYHSIMFDSVNNVNHLNVVTINKSTWVVTFHTSNFALN